MASKIGQQSSALALFEQIKEKPYLYSLFDVLRYVEAVNPDKPRLGESVKVTDDPILIRQQPSMAFAPATISKFVPGYKNQDQLYNLPYGVFGPNGPLPLHLTEYAYERELQEGDETFSRFADVFHHRMISLLFRAWANTQPSIGLDRPETNKFDQFVGAIAGTYVDDDRLGDRAIHPKLYRAGLFSQQTRSADGLETLLCDHFQLPFHVSQYSGGWLTLRNSDRFRIGSHGFANMLGENSCLGSGVYDCQHKFTITTGELSFEQFEKLLPSTESYKTLYDLITDYIGISFEWDLVLKLKASETPAWTLGQKGHLGWTNWLGESDDSNEISVVHLQSRSVMHYGVT
jgi:type VI secretion system protein ImpH